MGLFSKKPKEKEKEKCPACGNEMAFFKQTGIEGGTVFICNDCAAKLRGQFDLQSEWKYDSFRSDNKLRFKTSDQIGDVTLQEVLEIFAEREAAQTEAVESYVGAFEHLFKVDEVVTIAPKALEVGIARAKAYKNRRVVKGMVVKGSFEQKDTVTIQNGDTPTEVQILELIPCDGIDFMTNLQAHIHKKTAAEGGNAWLVLDLTTDIPVGSTICK